MYCDIILISILIFVCKFQLNLSQDTEFNRLTCSSSTCRFGECEQLEFDFRCHCDPGVKGILCDRLLKENDNLCLSSPCWNGGVCKQIGNDFQCECVVGNTGKNCRTLVNTEVSCLTNNPCKNNAICRVLSNNGLKCTCVGDWSGEFCDIPLSLCLRKEPCLNGGTCSNNRCSCLPNFNGEFCQNFSPQKIQDQDQKIVVFNKGGYVADLKVEYSVTAGSIIQPTVQTGSIALGDNYAFYVPGSVDLNSETGVVLTVNAVAGIQVLRQKIKVSPECYHVWGTTLNPFWSAVDC